MTWSDCGTDGSAGLTIGVEISASGIQGEQAESGQDDLPLLQRGQTNRLPNRRPEAPMTGDASGARAAKSSQTPRTSA
jgi:hypothetical protein